MKCLNPPKRAYNFLYHYLEYHAKKTKILEELTIELAQYDVGRHRLSSDASHIRSENKKVELNLVKLSRTRS